MNNPLVSIVVCTCNRAHMLGQTMETIFAQDYSAVEVLVVDDGSTDQTETLVRSYGDKVRYHRKEKSCIAATRTLACRLAKGEYIAFQDDDDLMPPDRITRLLNALRRYPQASLAVGDWAYIDVQGNLTGERSIFHVAAEGDEPLLLNDGYEAVLRPLVTPLPHTTLFRREDGERAGWFDDARFTHACSDTDFFARLALLGPVVYVPRIVSYYRIGHAQIWAKELLCEYSRFLLMEKHLSMDGKSTAAFKKRLRERLLGAMERIAFLRHQAGHSSDSLPGDLVERGLAQLDFTGRLAYRWYSSVRLPMKEILKGRNGR